MSFAQTRSLGVQKGLSKRPARAVTSGTGSYLMKARSIQSGYLEKFPPLAPKLWLVETGELFSPVAMRRPMENVSLGRISAPKRALRRYRSRFCVVLK